MSLPPLGAITSPTYMADVFARHLCGDTTAVVVGCRVARYRFRPGERCFVQYVVSVGHPGDATEELRVTGQWYETSGRSARLARKLQVRADTVRVTGTEGPLPPVFFDAPSAMLATVFPFDRYLAGLPALVAGSDADVVALMARQLGEETGAPLSCRVETVRYREHLSAVCRYTLQTTRRDGSAARRRFYAKAYRDTAGAAAAAQLHRLARATAACPGAARVLAPTGFLTDRRVLIMPEAPGQSLEAALRQVSSDEADRALTRVACALACFGRVAHGPDRRIDAASIRRGLERSVAVLGSAPTLGGGLAATAERVAGAIDTGLEPSGLLHGDIKLEHVFLDPQFVYLVDLDSCAHGDPVWDLATLLARLADGDVRLPAAIDAVWSRVTDAYAAATSRPRRAKLTALSAAACLDVAAGLVRRQEPRWALRAGALVERARCASGLP